MEDDSKDIRVRFERMLSMRLNMPRTQMADMSAAALVAMVRTCCACTLRRTDVIHFYRLNSYSTQVHVVGLLNYYNHY